MIGRTLGRFRIVSKLGQGGMGSVWRGVDSELGRTAALKILSPTLWDSEEARQRFLREARSAAKLEHTGIATVYDIGETDGIAWIAYRFVDGETVAALAERGPVPVARALAIARGTAEALAHAHEHGVLHRDVTAGNVMVTRDGAAVLVDFGLALPERSTRVTTTGGVRGTAGYMAPEVIRGQAADERSDLYGLGAVLYRLLTGRLPFEGEEAATLFYRAVREPAPPPSELRPDLPAELERVVLKLLEREPADRFASANEVVAALRDVAPDARPSSGIRARRSVTRSMRRLGETIRRVGRRRIGVATLAGVAVVAAGGWFAAKQGWLPGAASGPQVLAVLPFENTSANPEDVAYLADGLGDELVLKLGRAHGYRVLPWTTTRQVQDRSLSIQQTAELLRADVILVGTFRADAERVRVTASLVDGKSGLQRWSQSFDYLLSDLMSLQANIATGVAVEILGGLDAAERNALSRPPSASPEAYAMYLQGAEFLQSNELSTRALAQPFFDRAIALDPRLAEAYVGRGAAVLDLHFRGTQGGIASLEHAEADFRKALELDPGLARARRGLVTVAFEVGQPEAGLRVAADLAIRSDSDVDALLVRAWACFLFGFPEVGETILLRVLELDPANQEAAWTRVVNSEWGDQHERTMSTGRDYIQRFGEDPEIYLWMGIASAMLDSVQAADLLMGRALELMGDDSSNLYGPLYCAYFLERSGDAIRARAIADHWIPLLRERLSLNPDNYRIRAALIGFEGLVGDTETMRQNIGAFSSQLGQSRNYSSAGSLFAIFGLLEAGTTEDLRVLTEKLQKTDLGILHLFRSDWYAAMLNMQDHVPGEQRVEIYRALQADVRKRMDELGRRYLPSIALRDGAT